jgi:CheY-like chemotaxis protein
MTASERPIDLPRGSAEREAKRDTLGAWGEARRRVLIVEDSGSDVLLLLEELRHGGYEPLHRRAETLEALEEALDQERWDVVVSDNRLRLFSGADALALVRQRGLDLPFILVSEEIDENVAAALIRDGGVHDYVTKDDLSRLAPAVGRGLREIENRRQWRRPAEEAVGEAEAKYQTLFDNALEGIFWGTVDGRLESANPVLARILGYASPEELISCITDIPSQIYADPAYLEELLE